MTYAEANEVTFGQEGAIREGGPIAALFANLEEYEKTVAALRSKLTPVMAISGVMKDEVTEESPASQLWGAVRRLQRANAELEAILRGIDL